MQKTLFSFLALGLFSPAVFSATGNDLREWGQDYDKNRGTFTNGVYMGYIAGVSNTFDGLGFCSPEHMTNGQSSAVVWKWLSAHPERWAENGSNLVLSALSEAFPCKK